MVRPLDTHVTSDPSPVIGLGLPIDLEIGDMFCVVFALELRESSLFLDEIPAILSDLLVYLQ